MFSFKSDSLIFIVNLEAKAPIDSVEDYCNDIATLSSSSVLYYFAIIAFPLTWSESPRGFFKTLVFTKLNMSRSCYSKE